MPQRPEDELPPGLQTPTEAAAQRAKPIFDRLVGEMRAARAAAAVQENPSAAPSAPAAPVPRAAEFGGGRRYDVALSLVAGLAARPPPASPAAPLPAEPTPPAPLPHDDEVTRLVKLDSGLDSELDSELESELESAADSALDGALEPTVMAEWPLGEATQTQVRPPVGAPTVRQSVKRPARPGPPTAAMLQTAESAMLRTESDGTMAFDIVFNDAVFSDLLCTISVNNGRATAVFRVPDDTTRRLLEGEIGRLRAGLEDRGLKVEEVKVILT